MNPAYLQEGSRDEQGPLHIDQFTFVGGVVVIAGWARDFDPELLFKGVRLSLISERRQRDDVAAALGDPAAAGWGFIASALLPFDDGAFGPDLEFRVNSGARYVDPAEAFRADTDVAMNRMQDRFFGSIRAEGGRLLEIGSRARRGISSRNLFPADLAYVGMDITAGPNVDIVGDAHELSRLTEGKFDFIYSSSVFEHLLMPWRVAIEMNKVLRPGGMALIISHAAWPLHDEPWDYWRFSKDAWAALFNRHTGFEMLDAQYRALGFVAPRLANEAATRELAVQNTYLGSACLVRRTHDATVVWDGAATEIADLAYSHGMTLPS